MHPIAPRPTVLPALLLIGYFRALLRLALPGTPLAAHSGASNCCFYCFGPMKSNFPFGLSLSKPFDRLRANGSYFTGSDQ